MMFYECKFGCWRHCSCVDVVVYVKWEVKCCLLTRCNPGTTISILKAIYHASLYLLFSFSFLFFPIYISYFFSVFFHLVWKRPLGEYDMFLYIQDALPVSQPAVQLKL